MATDYEKLVHNLITANQKACEAVSQVSDGGTANRYESMNDALEGKTNGAFIEKVELTQFTGLKDARGKEIYAGDIMQDSDDCYNIVEWSNECGAWLVRVVMADVVKDTPNISRIITKYGKSLVTYTKILRCCKRFNTMGILYE